MLSFIDMSGTQMTQSQTQTNRILRTSESPPPLFCLITCQIFIIGSKTCTVFKALKETKLKRPLKIEVWVWYCNLILVEDSSGKIYANKLIYVYDI